MIILQILFTASPFFPFLKISFVPGVGHAPINGNAGHALNAQPGQFIRPQFGNDRNDGGGASHPWQCSDKQRDLILKIMDEQQLSNREVDDLSARIFGQPLSQLNKLQAFGLIATD
jgi:hypothetical protein